MKILNRTISAILCLIIFFHSAAIAPGAETLLSKTPHDGKPTVSQGMETAQNIKTYHVPIISNESPDLSVPFYECDGKFYLNIENIKTLTRCTLDDTDTTLTLSHGIRKIEIDKATGILSDSGAVSQDGPSLLEYDGKCLCEGIPMLLYLGASCSIREDKFLEILMPPVTIWESILPESLDFQPTSAPPFGTEGSPKNPLACGILANIMVGLSGHGLIASADADLEDALNQILDVDILDYGHVKKSAAAQNKKLNRFLLSECFRNYFEQQEQPNPTCSIPGLLEHYANFYFGAGNSKDNPPWENIYPSDNLQPAFDLAMSINRKIYEESTEDIVIDTTESMEEAWLFSTAALDTAFTSYHLIRYHRNTQTLFSGTFTDAIHSYQNNRIISWAIAAHQLQSEQDTQEASSTSSALDAITDFISGQLAEYGIERLLSRFSSKKTIYDIVTQLNTCFALPTHGNIPRTEPSISLNTIYSDLAQLVSCALHQEQETYHFSDTDSLKKLKDLLALYYRAAIAFSENMENSMGKTFVSCSRTALYLYRLTNCTIVPITDFSAQKDRLLSPKWLENFKEKGSIDEQRDEEELLDILQSVSHKQPEKYVFVDMNHDGAKELIATISSNGNLFQIWYCSNDGKTCQQVHSTSEDMDGCDIEVLDLGTETHIAINAYCMMGTRKSYSILSLNNKKISCLLMNQNGYVSMDEIGNILLNVEAYDSIYDTSVGDLIGHSWKDTYLYFDGSSYKEYGAAKISEDEFLSYENAQTLKDRITESLAQTGIENLEFSYFLRKNGILHVQCTSYEKSGMIQYGYYTIRSIGHTLDSQPGKYHPGQMAASFSDLEAVFPEGTMDWKNAGVSSESSIPEEMKNNLEGLCEEISTWAGLQIGYPMEPGEKCTFPLSEELCKDMILKSTDYVNAEYDPKKWNQISLRLFGKKTVAPQEPVIGDWGETEPKLTNIQAATIKKNHYKATADICTNHLENGLISKDGEITLYLKKSKKSDYGIAITKIIIKKNN